MTRMVLICRSLTGNHSAYSSAGSGAGLLMGAMVSERNCWVGSMVALVGASSVAHESVSRRPGVPPSGNDSLCAASDIDAVAITAAAMQDRTFITNDLTSGSPP